MSRNIIGGLVGGIILFFWGFLAWTVLPIHTSSMRTIQNEDAVIDVLHQSLPAKGMYFFPGMSHANGAPSPETEKAWTEKYQRGPLAMVMYDPQGSNPMMPMQMVAGILLNVLSAFLVAWFLARSTAVASSYFSRVAYCGMFGVFLMLASQLISWNWLNQPNDWVVGLIIDDLAAWLLAGLGIAAVVKKPAGTTPVPA